MRKKPTPSSEPSDAMFRERRATRQGDGTANPLKQIKGALGRPVAMEWRNGQPHVVLVERRSAAGLDREQAHLCAELQSRLLVQAADETSKLLRCLVVVHDTLRKKGWAGVGALPAGVLARASMQADMLAEEDQSPALKTLAERLRKEHAEALARDAAKPAGGEDAGGLEQLEITDGSFNEFEELERSWTRTMPSDLAPLHADG